MSFSLSDTERVHNLTASDVRTNTLELNTVSTGGLPVSLARAFSANIGMPVGNTTLAVNTQYIQGQTAAAIKTLPSAAISSAGDEIVVWYQAIVAAGSTQVYQCAGTETLNVASVLTKNAVAPSVGFTLLTPPLATNNKLNIVGLLNAGAGAGSVLRFYFDGAKWGVVAREEPSGTGAVASTSIFA